MGAGAVTVVSDLRDRRGLAAPISRLPGKVIGCSARCLGSAARHPLHAHRQVLSSSSY